MTSYKERHLMRHFSYIYKLFCDIFLNFSRLFCDFFIIYKKKLLSVRNKFPIFKFILFESAYRGTQNL